MFMERTTTSVVLGDDLIAQIDKVAAQKHLSRSAYVRLVLSERIEEGARRG